MSSELAIEPAGGDTGAPLNLHKRVAWIARAAGPLSGKRILDCGCGSGEYVHALSDLGGEVWGIEYSREKVASSRQLAGPFAERVCVGDIQHMGFEDGRFDVALVNEVLEHVPDDHRGLEEVYRILAPGGMLIVFSPNRLYPFETHGVYRRGSRRRIPHYAPFVPYLPLRLGRALFEYWARNYWPWELRAMVERCGFAIREVGYVWQTFENISGRQPGAIRALRPLLRAACGRLERIPLLRSFGASQVVVANKRGRP